MCFYFSFSRKFKGKKLIHLMKTAVLWSLKIFIMTKAITSNLFKGKAHVSDSCYSF